MPARTTAGRRRSIQNFPYSIFCPSTSNNSLLVGTSGVPTYAYEHTQPFSIWFWINPLSIPANGNIFCECGAGSPFRGIIIRHSTTRLDFRLISGSGGGEASMSFPICPIGQWTKVVLTYAGNSLASGLKAYYNNTLQTGTVLTNNLTGTIVEAGVTTRWGAFSSGSLGPDAYLIPGGIVNYEMSAAQAVDIWNDNKVTGTAAVDQYACSEGSGTTVASTGTGAHSLTLVGSTIAWNTSSPMKARTPIPQPRLPIS